MFLGKFPQLQKLYTYNEITEGLNVLSLNQLPKLSKSLGINRSHSQPSMSYLERKERELRIVHRFQILATIADTMNNEEADDGGIQFKQSWGENSHREERTSKRQQLEDDTQNTVFVGNISYRMTSRDLKKFFMKFGCVVEARLVKDHVKKLSRGIAFVTFGSKAAATMAIDADAEERTLDGREMRVFPAREKRMKMFKKELEAAGDANDINSCQMETERTDRCPESETPILKLNDDTLITIFSYLSLDDLYEVQHVCRPWKKVAARCWAAKKVLNFTNSFSTFGKRGMNDYIFREILRHCGGNLRELDLSSIARFLDYKSMELIANNCCNLESLNLSGGDITIVGIKDIAKKCTNLKVILLNRCINIGEKGLWWLLHLGRNLTHIDISSNLRITGKCFYHLGPNVTVLTLSSCSRIIDYGFEQIGQRCTLLSELTLDGCASLTNHGLQQICSGCSELRKLSLSGQTYPSLTSEGLTHIGKLKQLRELNLARNCNADDNSLCEISAGCRKLEVLDLCACGSDVSDASVESFVECENLRSINIGYLEKVTDGTLSIVAGNGRLEEVKARGNMNITSQGCHNLLMQCPRLRLLDLSGCESVGNRALDVCLQVVASRDAGPQLVIIIGGSGIDVKKLPEVAHPLLCVDTMNLCIRQYFPDSYIPDMGLSDMDDYSDEDQWAADDDFLNAEDPMLEFERENMS